MIDAENGFAALGFVEAHAHVDGMALLRPDMEGYLFQGIEEGELAGSRSERFF